MSLNNYLSIAYAIFAEGEGFEPPNPLRSTVFKTAAINHSANPPSRKGTANLCNLYGYSKKIQTFLSAPAVGSFSPEAEKYFHWKRRRYIAPTVTQESAKLNTGLKNITLAPSRIMGK